MKRILFDAHSILKWTQKEAGYERVKRFMLGCRDGSVTGYMNVLNLGEVYYRSIRTAGTEKAKAFLENFQRLPIDLILPDKELIWKASEIKAEYAISFGDCFAAATALRYDAKIVTGDPEFKKLGKLVTIEWV
jgi:predicted nucleic acid-binding protein